MDREDAQTEGMEGGQEAIGDETHGKDQLWLWESEGIIMEPSFHSHDVEQQVTVISLLQSIWFWP